MASVGDFCLPGVVAVLEVGLNNSIGQISQSLCVLITNGLDKGRGPDRTDPLSCGLLVHFSGQQETLKINLHLKTLNIHLQTSPSRHTLLLNSVRFPLLFVGMGLGVFPWSGKSRAPRAGHLSI